MNITEFFPEITGPQAQKASIAIMEAALTKHVRLHKELIPYLHAAQNAKDADPLEMPFIFESIRHYTIMPGMVEFFEAALDPFSSNSDSLATLDGISRYFQYVLLIEEQKRIIANSI